FELSKVLDPSTRVTRQDLVGKPALVHVWATWCQVCAYEHKNLVKIAKNSSYPIFGINYRDDPVLARRWLLVEGDPYQIAIQDEKGKLGLDLGIYGTPEMFILDAQGIIRYRQVGPIDEQYYYAKLVPLLKKLEDEKYVIP
ncbi:MAG TPA: DsbE family thiol:disulfide interchange protein, partial [Gammaproteobacteria bacterium]|nr:DsbE family thiol:disulfide interchange protein [Gammaproteobacteria bacterium]